MTGQGCRPNPPTPRAKGQHPCAAGSSPLVHAVCHSTDDVLREYHQFSACRTRLSSGMELARQWEAAGAA